MHLRTILALFGIAILVPLPAAEAQTATPAQSAMTFDWRVRAERVDDDAFAESAEALTLRARIGYRFVIDSRWSALLEAEHTGHLGPSRYNSSSNGEVAFPLVVDPDNTELNQALIAFTPNNQTRLNLGRQQLSYANQRFIGNVGWRQNEQTFDALDAHYSFVDGPSLRYSYLDRVQRIFGQSHPNSVLARWNLDAHVLEAGQRMGAGQLTGYAHWFDNRSLPLSSHRNLGLRYQAQGGAVDGIGWTALLEFAEQRPFAQGAAQNEAKYLLLEGGLRWQGHQFSAGIEQLGGDGRYGFQTPFATGHAFNGWTDRFLNTPVNGLRDYYIGWKRGIDAFSLQIVLHDYSADHGSASYGTEIDAALGWAFRPKWNALFKFARYSSDGFGADVDKLWLSVEYKL